MFGVSNAFLKMRATGICPACGKFHLYLNVYRGDGRKCKPWELLSGFKPDVYQQCARCDTKVYADPAQGHNSPWPPASQPMTPRAEVTETHRSEEPIGEDRRSIDNTQSRSEFTRKISVSKGWTRTYEIEHSQETTLTGGLNVKASSLAQIEASAEQAIQERYAIAQTERQTYTEEVTVRVKGETHLHLTFLWKRIWQHGVVEMYQGNELVEKVPFRTVVGVTFDQIQRDEHYSASPE